MSVRCSHLCPGKASLSDNAFGKVQNGGDPESLVLRDLCELAWLGYQLLKGDIDLKLI